MGLDPSCEFQAVAFLDGDVRRVIVFRAPVEEDTFEE
jgi:hypothetical protein